MDIFLKYIIQQICIRKYEPDYSEIPNCEHEWEYYVYGDVKEFIPNDIPELLGNRVTLTTYVDANLYHDMITDFLVTGILHLIKGITFEWYSKKQSTVETATYGSEFVAERIVIDQIIDHLL